MNLPASLADGRYPVERLLGSGGMAIVVLARDEELDRPVAIKLLADNLADDDGIRRRFMRESRLAARLSHPNIVRVYDARDEERPYFVMEYVDGQSVAEEVDQRGCLDWRRALEIAGQVCAALEHAHGAGVIHRDVKPSNLLVDGENVVKVADFGIAIAEDGTRLTASNLALGSMPYLAPERLRDPDAVTAAADLYSLGVVVYELVAGCRPFPCDSLEQIVHRSPQDSPPCLCDSVPDLPAEVDSLIRSCLAAEPENRPSSAKGLAAGLSEALPAQPSLLVATTNGTETVAATGEAAPTVESGREIHWRMVIAATVIAAIIIAGLFGAMALIGNGGGGRAGAISPPRVDPSASPAQSAHRLADWFRAESRPPGP
jgi:serine/threonine-protein kinase